MKKLIFISVLSGIISFHSFVQSGNFITASVFAGPTSCWTSSDEVSDITSKGLSLKIGYQFESNFQLSTGLSYITTGYSQELGYNMPPPVYYEEYRFAHVLIPLELGYSFRLGQRFRLIPSVSIGVSHLLRGSYFAQTDHFFYQDLKGTLRNNYCSYTGWVGTALQLSYNFTEHISIVSGFQMNSMVTTFAKGSFSYLNGELMYAVNGDVGIKYSF